MESTNRRRCINQDILFAGTNTGKIVKIVFGRNGSTTVPVVSEEITVSLFFYQNLDMFSETSE